MFDLAENGSDLQVIVFDPSIQNQPQQFGGLLERYRILMNDATAAAEAAVDGGAAAEGEASSQTTKYFPFVRFYFHS